MIAKLVGELAIVPVSVPPAGRDTIALAYRRDAMGPWWPHLWAVVGWQVEMVAAYCRPRRVVVWRAPDDAGVIYGFEGVERRFPGLEQLCPN